MTQNSQAQYQQYQDSDEASIFISQYEQDENNGIHLNKASENHYQFNKPGNYSQSQRQDTSNKQRNNGGQNLFQDNQGDSFGFDSFDQVGDKDDIGNIIDKMKDDLYIEDSLQDNKVENQIGHNVYDLGTNQDGIDPNSKEIKLFTNSSFLLPGFYIEAQNEDAQNDMETLEDQHIQKLVDDYNKLHNNVQNSQNSQHENSQMWQAEEYEEDKVIGQNSDNLTLFKILQKNPSQCVRYGFGQKPLLPESAMQRSIPKCEHCGADCVFELQVMTPTIHYIEESSQWIGNKDLIKQVEDVLNQWVWLTIVIYTCSKSCHTRPDKDGFCLLQEHVVVHLENEMVQRSK